MGHWAGNLVVYITMRWRSQEERQMGVKFWQWMVVGAIIIFDPRKNEEE
jgi:hypothetical protein